MFADEREERGVEVEILFGQSEGAYFLWVPDRRMGLDLVSAHTFAELTFENKGHLSRKHRTV